MNVFILYVYCYDGYSVDMVKKTLGVYHGHNSVESAWLYEFIFNYPDDTEYQIEEWRVE